MTNKDFRELLEHYPRLKSFYEIGIVQRTELEAFVNSALKADMVGVTADGELVQAGDQVWVFSALEPRSQPLCASRKRSPTTNYLARFQYQKAGQPSKQPLTIESTTNDPAHTISTTLV